MEQNQTTQLEKDILQAQQEFLDQFNPNSVNYHKGNQQSVPIGGKNIPKGMESMYEESKQNKIPAEINYGKTYDDLMASRSFLMEMKKDLAKICPILEAIMRHKENFKAKGNQENQQHLETLQNHVETEKSKLTPVLEVLQKYIAHFEQQQDQFIKDKYIADLKKICTDSEKEFKDKEEFMEYQILVKKVSSSSFNDAKKLLDQIKKIKKEVETKLLAEKENNQGAAVVVTEQQQVQQQEQNEEKKDTQQQNN